ncbi:MAG TPA: winged helix-turn-helix transcriptional regulator [Methanomassiliicoccales archaeon]|nr:winged helix-turn-helix transcriptional regulator [Methanomassiliicoccales archaeon]
MSNEKGYDSILGEAYAVNILVFLYDQGSAVATEMRAVASNYNTIVKVAKKLEEHGLLNISIVTSPRVTHTYRLTEKGKHVAQKLKEIEEIIGG